MLALALPDDSGTKPGQPVLVWSRYLFMDPLRVGVLLIYRLGSHSFLFCF